MQPVNTKLPVTYEQRGFTNLHCFYVMQLGERYRAYGLQTAFGLISNSEKQVIKLLLDHILPCCEAGVKKT